MFASHRCFDPLLGWNDWAKTSRDAGRAGKGEIAVIFDIFCFGGAGVLDCGESEAEAPDQTVRLTGLAQRHGNGCGFAFQDHVDRFLRRGGL